MIFVRPEAVYMLSDGIAYDDDGRVQQIHSKQLLLPHLNAIIHVTGTGPILSVLDYQINLGNPRTYEELIAQMPELLTAVDNALSGPQFHEPPIYEVFIGGWSEDVGRFRGYAVWCSIDSGIIRSAPELITHYAKPNPSEKYLQAVGLSASLTDLPKDLEKMHPIEFGCRFMLAQRRTRVRLHNIDERQGYVVGGFCQLSTLTRNKIQSEILWRWPDSIGEFPDPSLDQTIHLSSDIFLNDVVSEGVSAKNQ